MYKYCFVISNDNYNFAVRFINSEFYKKYILLFNANKTFENIRIIKIIIYN